MAEYAVVEQSTGKITNRIVLDDPAAWPVPEGHVIVEETSGAMEVGGTYVNGVYTPPPAPPPVSAGTTPPSPQTTVLYDHENRIRAQEGAPPLTLQDFITKAGL